MSISTTRDVLPLAADFRRAIFWRLQWKEMRYLRGFWLGAATLGLGAVAFGLWLRVVGAPAGASFEAIPLLAIALASAPLYAVGAAGALFAGEREEETARFLSALPVGAKTIFWSKLALLAWTTLMLMMMNWLFGYAMLVAAGRAVGYSLSESWATISAEVRPRIAEPWGLCGVAAIEAIAWGTLLSLRSKRPVPAALAAIACAAVAAQAITWAITPDATAYPAMRPYVSAGLSRLAVATLAMAASLVRHGDWLTTAGAYRWPLTRTVTAHAESDELAGTAAAKTAANTTRLTTIGRLVWQQWRQSRGLFVACASLGVALGVVAAQLTPLHTDAVNPVVWPFVALLVFSALIGSCAFLEDQSRDGKRFLVERGVSARRVWSARLIACGWAIVVLLGIAVQYMATRPLPTGPSVSHFDPLVQSRIDFWERLHLFDFRIFDTLLRPVVMWWQVFAAVVVAAFAAGQLASILCRRGLIAVIVGALLSLTIGIWAVLMWALRVPLIWSVWPITLTMFACSHMYAGHWILDRRLSRAKTMAFGVVAVAMAFTYAAVAHVRVREIPVHPSPADPGQFIRPRSAAEQATADAYRHAYEAYRAVADARRGERPRDLSREQQEAVDRHWERIANEFPLDGLHDQPVPRGTEQLVAASEQAIELAVQASNHDECGALAWEDRAVGSVQHKDYFRRYYEADELRQLVEWAARVADHAGKLDEARTLYVAALRIKLHWELSDEYDWWKEHWVLREFPKWAARPGQTAERVRSAMGDLASAERLYHPRSVRQRFGYSRALASLASLERGEFDGYSDDWMRQSRQDHLLNRFLPGERDRARRLVTFQFSEIIARLERLEELMRHGQAVAGVATIPSMIDRSAFSLNQTTPSSAGRLPYTWQDVDIELYESARDTCKWRATKLLMAIQLWRLEHGGELPEKLDQLVGHGLEAVPLDPFTGQPFAYFPNGLSVEKLRGGGLPECWGNYSLPAGTPIIWAAAAVNTRPPTTEYDGHVSDLIWHWTSDPLASAQTALLAQGFAYPIPLAAPQPTFPEEPTFPSAPD